MKITAKYENYSSIYKTFILVKFQTLIMMGWAIVNYSWFCCEFFLNGWAKCVLTLLYKQ